MPYRIKERQRQAAKRLNVAIRPSSDKNKKLDVYKNGFLIARIGAAGYGDYATPVSVLIQQDRSTLTKLRSQLGVE